MKVGFVGLSLLGSAIVKRLSSQGIKVTLWNRSIEKAKTLGFKLLEKLPKLN